MTDAGMSAPGCEDMALLIQADHDGELDAVQSARVAAHLAVCPACAAQAASLRQLSGRLRTELRRQPLPPRLAKLVAESAPPNHNPWQWVAKHHAPGFAAGLALAACIALALIPRSRPENSMDAAVSAHLRALQPGHLMDVASSDRHTVKPWFDGKLPFAPTVRDFAADGFPLKGGRLDVLNNHPVAALVYARRLHVIDVFIWPAPAALSTSAVRDGYLVEAWSDGGMRFCAVSDLAPAEMGVFRGLWREQ